MLGSTANTRSPEPPDAGDRSPKPPSSSTGLRFLLLVAVAGLLTCDWITALGNDPPGAVGTIPDHIVEVDSAVLLDLAAYFTDPDGDSLTYAAFSMDLSRAAVTVAGSVLTVTGVAKGETSVTAIATDPDSLTATQSFAVTVPNRGPLVADTIAAGEVYVDSALVIDAAAYFADPDGDDLEYSAMSSDSTRAAVAVSGSTLTVTGMAVGSTTVTVTVRDPDGLEAGQSFGVTVPNRAPVAIAEIEDRELEVDSVVALDVAAYFADPDRDTLVYAAASSDSARAAVVVSGSLVMLTGVAKGAVTVTVTARDPGGLEAGLGFVVTVPNRAPAAEGAIEARELYVGDEMEIDVVAYFADPDGDPLEYAAVSSDTARAGVAVSGAVVTVSGVAVGTTTVTVTARDPEGLSAEQAFAVTIPNRPPLPVGTIADRNVFVGDTATLDVAAYFTEPDGETLQYAVASSSSAMATVAISGGTVTIAALAVGDAAVTVTAQDPHGAWAEQAFAVTVPNRAPRPTGRIADRVVQVDSVVVVDVADRFTEPDGEELEYSAASSDTARVAVSMSAGALTVLGVARGSATVTVTARDPGDLTAQQHFEVTVPNRAPQVVGTIDYRVVGAGSSVAVDVAANFTDPDGDSLRYSATSTDPGRATVVVSGSVLTVTGVAGGNAIVTVTARDAAGLRASLEFGVRVPNQPPEAVATIADRAVEINRSISLDVAPYFSDPDGDDLTHGATSSNTTRATVSVSGSTVTIMGRRAGFVTVTVTATDPGGLSATRDFRVRIVQGNRTPRRVGTMPGVSVAAGNAHTENVSTYFSDPDGDDLDFAATSSNTGIAAASVTGTTLTVTAVAEGAATITVTATDPGGLSATQSFDVSVEPAPPSDLVVEPPSANPNVLGPGESFTLSATVYNQGSGSASSGTTLRYYSSADATIDTGDTEIGSDAVAHLGPSLSNTQSLQVTAPSGFATYYYGACADPVDNESDTNNNCSSAVAVEVTEANRAPRAVGTMPDRTLEPGDAVSVDVAPYFTEPDGDALTYGAASSNTGVATVTRSGSAVTVAAGGAGRATITVTATDPGGLSATQRFDVTVQAPAESDLVVLSPAAHPSALAPGEAFTLSAVVHNQGAGGASSSTQLRYYRSADASISTGDTQIGADAVAQLGPSQSSDESVALTAPTAQGTYYYGACVEAVGNESDTGNNCSGAVAVEVTRPNQAPRAVGTIPDQTVNIGGEVEVDVEAYFTDPDGDDLDYTVASSNTTVATVGVSGDHAQVRGEDDGDAIITVTATDPGGLSANQSFTVTVEDLPNRAPVVAYPIADLPNTTPAERYIGYLLDVFTDPDNDDLAWTTSSANDAVAESEISGDSIVVTTISVGTTTVTVTATDPDGLFATDTFDVEVVAERFDIDLHFTETFTNAQRERIERARDHWESILAGTELSDVDFSFAVTCHGLTPDSALYVDDHAVLVGREDIDGAGGTWAYAGYCYRRSGDDMPIVSTAIFDNADIGRVLSSGNLAELAFHEFAHGLGFIGHHWELHNLLDTGTDPHFTGALATEAFDTAGGTAYTGSKVPVSSPGHGHWRESVLGREGMTPFLVRWTTNPFSAITLQAMADVGYVVDVSLADDYELPNTVPPDIPADQDEQVIDLSNDVVQGPVMVIDDDGRVVRVIPAPPGTVLPTFRRQEVRLDLRERDGPGTWVRSRPP